MSFRGCALAAIALVTFGLAPVARADDTEKVHDRTREARAAFAPPAAERGFSFSFVVLAQGGRIGTGRFTAVPGTLDGRTAWKVAERVESAAAAVSLQADGWLAPDLRVLRWKSLEGGSGGRKVVLERGKDGLVRTDPGATEEERSLVEDEGTATAGLVGVLLFLRLVPPSTEMYGFMVADGPEPEILVLQDQGEGRLEEGPVSVAARVTKAMRGSRELEVFRGAQSGEFLAIRVPDEGVVFLRDDLFGPKKKVDFSKPATTPRAAAGRFLLGMLLGDRRLLESAVHWPTFFAPFHEIAKSKGKRFDEAAFKKSFLDKFVAAIAEYRETAADLPGREQAEAVLEAALEKATEEPGPDGTTRVRVAAPLTPLTLPVKRAGAAWHVVGVPTPDR